jgi:tRNA modification GTPase
MRQKSSTITAIATYPAASALGLIRISGSMVFPIIKTIFKPRYNKNFPDTAEPVLGIISDNGSLIDEALVTLYRAPRSYTGDDMAEISCHGNPFILSKIISLISSLGASEAGPGDFTRRAFLNGKMDLTQAEAVADISGASSDAALSISLNQLFGAEKKAINSLRLEIVKALTLLEANLDFEQDPGETSSGTVISSLNSIRSSLSSMIEGAARGIALKDGVRAVITGRPNAGKSSLLNAVTGTNRAIVTHLPGTTRDTIEAGAMIGPIKFTFIDTAGIRVPRNIVENEGIKRAKAAVAASDIVLFVIDASEELSNEDRSLFSEISGRPAVIVLNKSDLSRKTTPEKAASFLASGNIPVIFLSTVSGHGINDLTNTLKSIIIKTKGLDNESSVIVASIRHKAALETALLEINMAIESMPAGYEIASEHVKEAASRAGSIIGEVASEDVLDSIFKNFCVGK